MPNDKEEKQNEERRSPAIRTMKSDIEELVKETKPSFLEMVGQEVRRGTRRDAGPRKNGTRLLFWGGAGVVLLFLAFLGFIFLLPQEEDSAQQKLVPPPPFFAVETSRTVTVERKERTLFLRLMQDSAREQELQGTIKRIVMKLADGTEERFATLQDLFGFYRIDPPGNLFNAVGTPLMTFFYQGNEGTRFGFAVRIRDHERTLGEMLSWESSLLLDFRPFFFDETPEAVIAPFEDRTYRNIDWRFLKLSPAGDLGIAYAIFPARDLLIVTSSKESFETVINRLFDAR